MSDDPLAGGIHRAGADRLEGWCWSPAQPGQRRTVDILLDDRPVAAVTANLFRRDLATAGIGDGRHGFVLPLADAAGLTIRDVEQAGMIDLRDRASGRIVSRLRQHRAEATRDEDRRVAAAAASLAGIAVALAPPVRAAPAAGLRRHFTALGDRLAGREGDIAALGAADPVAVASAELRRRFAPLHVPIVGAPALSFVLRAADVGGTWRAIAALAPALRMLRAELLVVHDGADPLVALLGGVIGNLVLIRGGAGLAAAVNAAATIARGARLAVLAADAMDPPAPHALAAALAARCDTRGGDILLGATAAAAAARLGVVELLGPRSVAPEGLAALDLGIDRALLDAVGGLDPAFAAADALACLDLALKAALLGTPIRAVAAAAPARTAAPSPALGALLRRRCGLA